MSRYLEEAAALLGKAAATNETDNAKYPQSLNEGRERIARQFAELAAIESGQLPASIVDLVLNQITGGTG